MRSTALFSIDHAPWWSSVSTRPVPSSDVRSCTSCVSPHPEEVVRSKNEILRKIGTSRCDAGEKRQLRAVSVVETQQRTFRLADTVVASSDALTEMPSTTHNAHATRSRLQRRILDAKSDKNSSFNS